MCNKFKKDTISKVRKAKRSTSGYAFMLRIDGPLTGRAKRIFEQEDLLVSVYNELGR